MTITGKVSCQTSISGTMQAFDPSPLCSDVTSGTLSDSRDSKDYTIAKIGDTWWMTRNLNLAENTTVTVDDTNVTQDTLTTYGSKINGVKNSSSTTCENTSPRLCYGYFTLLQATFGSYMNRIAYNDSTIVYDIPSDICPKGWKLPSQSQFNSLRSAYPTGTALNASPWYGVYAGYMTNSGMSRAQDIGSIGYYLTGTIIRSRITSGSHVGLFKYQIPIFEYDSSSTTYGYFANDLNPPSGSGEAFPVRCVLK